YPDTPEARAETETPQFNQGEDGAGPPRRPAGPRPPHETKMDWAGMKRRTRQVTRMPFPISTFSVTPDSRTLVFVTSEPSATAQVPVIYSIQKDGRGLRRVVAVGPRQ